MALPTAAFEYHLPKRAIAEPPARRDRSRLLVLDRETGRIAHQTIRDLPALLAPGDCVVLNETKVFKARLRGEVDRRAVEVLLVRSLRDSLSASQADSCPFSSCDAQRESLPFSPCASQVDLFPFSPCASQGEVEGVNCAAWIVLAKPARRCTIGVVVRVGTMTGVVRERRADGSLVMVFDRSAASVIAYANRVGSVPTPPYVHRSVATLQEYQTSYAKQVGSVAAPTAGFHVTPRILAALRRRHIRIARVTLHVGLGTFQPIRTETLADHTMHAEWVDISPRAVATISTTKARGGRVIAIGTTTLRALEGVAQDGALRPHTGFVNCFITPGYRFRVVDALLTNFHLPASTLLVPVSAFAAPGAPNFRGRDLVLRAYRSALRRRYRFYSFGDAMLVR